MMNYERLLIERIPGATPKEKYDFYESLMETLTRVCYPRRGTDEQYWDQYEIVERLTPFVPSPNTSEVSMTTDDLPY